MNRHRLPPPATGPALLLFMAATLGPIAAFAAVMRGLAP